jgi:hypothetical protein
MRNVVVVLSLLVLVIIVVFSWSAEGAPVKLMVAYV